MFSALKNVRAALNLLPRVTATVLLIEELFDTETSGAEKKEIAVDALAEVGLPERFLTVAEDMIDLVVSVLNAVGVFDKTEEVGVSAHAARMNALDDLE